MDIIRFSANEMHLLVTFSALKGRKDVDWVLRKYKKSTIDPLRIEARAMIYLLAGLSEVEARKRSGCGGRDHDRLWAAIMPVYRELEPMAEARRQSSRRRTEESAHRTRPGFTPAFPHRLSYEELGIA